MKKTARNKNGSALIVVISFTLLSAILGAALLLGTRSQAHVVARQVDLERALFIAEAGVERAAKYVETQSGYLPASFSDTGTIGDGSYDFTLTKIGWRAFQLTSVGRVNGVAEEINIDRLYIPSYAKYALWMDTNGRIYFIPGEEFFGHVHSNDKIWFYSNPVEGGPEFWKELTTAWNEYGGTADWAQFHMGLELNAAEGTMADIDFNSASPQSLHNLADSMGLVLEGPTTIEFDGDDMKITNSRKGWNDHIVPIGSDQLVYVKDYGSNAGKVYLDGGEVDGRLTIVSEDDIRIKDHIRYYEDPRIYPSSDDALGLIARDDVWVDQGAPNNLDVHAAMIAAGTKTGTNRGSFGVLDYNRGGARGGLNIFGSIVQDKRGAVGTFNDQGIVSGFYKNYSFDDRFGTIAPPFYPVIGEKVQYSGWSEGPHI